MPTEFPSLRAPCQLPPPPNSSYSTTAAATEALRDSILPTHGNGNGDIALLGHQRAHPCLAPDHNNHGLRKVGLIQVQSTTRAPRPRSSSPIASASASVRATLVTRHTGSSAAAPAAAASTVAVMGTAPSFGRITAPAPTASAVRIKRAEVVRVLDLVRHDQESRPPDDDLIKLDVWERPERWPPRPDAGSCPQAKSTAVRRSPEERPPQRALSAAAPPSDWLPVTHSAP